MRLIFYIISISVNLRGHQQPEDLSWRGLIRRVFQQLQHVNCSRGQRDFRSQDALIRHIERSHPKDMDSVTFCTRTTLDRSTSSHCSIVTVTKKIWKKEHSLKNFPQPAGESFNV